MSETLWIVAGYLCAGIIVTTWFSEPERDGVAVAYSALAARDSSQTLLTAKRAGLQTLEIMHYKDQRPVVCPHGVDQSISIETLTRDGDVVHYISKKECLRCLEEAGVVVLMPETALGERGV